LLGLLQLLWLLGLSRLLGVELQLFVLLLRRLQFRLLGLLWVLGLLRLL
jgi:hypothetical protein